MGKLTKKTSQDCGGDSRPRQRYTNNSLSTQIPMKESGLGSSTRPQLIKGSVKVDTTESAKSSSKLRSPAKVRSGKSTPQPSTNQKPNMKMETEVHSSPTKSSQSMANDVIEKNELTIKATNDQTHSNSDELADLQKNKNGVEAAILEDNQLQDVKQNGNKDKQDMEHFSLQLEAEESSTLSNESVEKVTDQAADPLCGSESHNESHKSTKSESGSVEVVESTTSENVENQKLIPEKTKEDQVPSTPDPKGLMDVKVQLNDCLKEENNDQNVVCSNKDLSFSKTLRTLSGRRSISRMRNITVRDRQPSPNSSMFVNTSDMSQGANETGSYRTLRQRVITRDLNISNGRSENVSLKRKSEVEIENASKRSKSEGRSLNSSFEFLKYFRKSETETTPTKLNVSSDSKPEAIGEDLVTKRWCLIM